MMMDAVVGDRIVSDQIRSRVRAGQGRRGGVGARLFVTTRSITYVYSFIHHVEIDESRWEWELELDVGRESLDQAV